VLKYPDLGFIGLMILAMTILGKSAGYLLPRIVTGSHGRLSAAVFTIVSMTLLVAGSYYLAKFMAWVIFRLFHPKP